ncbi:MAG TPA: hypothetical protein VHE81_09410 [Lacipirellulaceae bacterium]|nr:hypothetical protein [Lacipirellulaceae bacterium]
MTETPSQTAPPQPPSQSGSDSSTTKSYPSADLIQHTIRVWEPRLGRTLSEEDARQIPENVVGFFRVLHSWDRAQSNAESEKEAGLDDG